jgi:hypothetical protein
MKKIAFTLIVAALLVGSTLGSATIGYAQASGPSLEDPEAITFSFDSLTDFSDQLLQSPYDTTRFSFGLPPSWELTEGAEIQLDLTSSWNHDMAMGGILEVYFNGMALDAVTVDWEGSRTVTVPIPAEALIPFRSDGRHEFRAILDTDFVCESNLQTTVIIHPQSRFVLPHRLVTPSIDLRSLPRPIYQGSFLPDTAILVVPDEPTQDELQAAITVAAGFGKMTGGNLGLELVPVGKLTPDLENANHLIFVGKPAGFPMLANVPLPAQIQGDGFQNLDRAATDGILQMAVSPWNPYKVVLVVSGVSDEAVVKAGQAISSAQIMTGEQSDIALVAEVLHDDPEAIAQPLDSTFAEAGYATETLNNIGIQTVYYSFYIPSGQQLSEDAYLDLVVSHSALLDYDLSSLTVRLNDEPIGSLSLNQDTTNLNHTQMSLPATSARSGSNALAISAELRPESACFDTRSENLWLTIHAESSMHLPLEPYQAGNGQVINLSEYPDPFVLDPDLSTTVFVLPSDDPSAWNVAAQIASNFGDKSRGAVMEPAVVYGEVVPQDLLETNHLVAIGKLNGFTFMEDLDQALSTQFESYAGLANEENMRVVYRLPLEASVGYLELLPSPWNDAFSVLAVVGRTEEGIQFAGRALTTSEVRRTMAGNFAIISDEQVLVANARFGFEAIDDGSDETIALFQQATTDQSSRGLLVLAILSGLALVVTLSVAITVFVMRRTRQANRGVSPE